jgi:isocitrate dehydrogenase
MKLAKDLYFQTRNKSQDEYIQIIFKFLEEYDDILIEKLDKYESDMANHHLKLRGVIMTMFNECLSDRQIKDNAKQLIQDFTVAHKNEIMDRITAKMKKMFNEREKK